MPLEQKVGVRQVQWLANNAKKRLARPWMSSWLMGITALVVSLARCTRNPVPCWLDYVGTRYSMARRLPINAEGIAPNRGSASPLSRPESWTQL